MRFRRSVNFTDDKFASSAVSAEDEIGERQQLVLDKVVGINPFDQGRQLSQGHVPPENRSRRSEDPVTLERGGAGRCAHGNDLNMVPQITVYRQSIVTRTAFYCFSLLGVPWRIPMLPNVGIYTVMVVRCIYIG